jgi:hypothetical protein
MEQLEMFDSNENDKELSEAFDGLNKKLIENYKIKKAIKEKDIKEKAKKELLDILNNIEVWDLEGKSAVDLIREIREEILKDF